MAIPATLWKVVNSLGWYTATTSPPADPPRSELYSVSYWDSPTAPATAFAATQIANSFRTDYLNTRIFGFWAEWLWWRSCTVTHVATGLERTNANRIRLGLTSASGRKDLPFNAAAFVFGRTSSLGVQCREWFGGLNSNVLTADGLVDWTTIPQFRNFAASQFAQRTVFTWVFDRVAYSPATETSHKITELLRVKQWRAIRRRSLTGSESFQPL